MPGFPSSLSSVLSVQAALSLEGTLPPIPLLPCLQKLALVLTLPGAISHLLSPLPQAFQNLIRAWATA